MGLHDEIEEIRSHIAILNDHSGEIDKTMTEIRIEMAGIKNDVCWLRKFFFLVSGASISSLIVGLFNLIIQEF